MKRLLLIAVALAALLLGGLSAVSEGRILLRAQASALWPVATGILQSVRVETGRTKTTSGRWLVVQYTYEVRGVRYTGRNLWPPGIHSGMAGDEVDLLAAQWTPGKPVPVRYDPADPAASALLPGLSAGMTGNLLLALLAVFGGAAILLLEWPRKSSAAGARP